MSKSLPRYSSESKMYPEVVAWLRNRLSSKHRRANIVVRNTSNQTLSRVITDLGLQEHFPEYLGYEVQCDVTGFAIHKTRADIYLVECKLRPISLKDFSQLLGYSRVVKPKVAVIVSPRGISRGMSELLNVHRRFDILEFASGRNVILATWDQNLREPKMDSLFPPGSRFTW